MADTINPFSPRSAENPSGALYREFTVTLAARSEDDTDPRLPIAISSEAAVERYDYMKGERYMEVLDHTTGGVDLTYARDGLPFCLDHSLRSQVGLLEDITIDDDRVIRGKLRKGNHPDAQWVFDDMAAGIRKKVSIGYWPGNDYEQTKSENGAIPTRRLKGWMLYEASSVSVPADYDVGVGRSAGGRVATRAEFPAAADKAHNQERVMSDSIAPVPGVPAASDTRVAELIVAAKESGLGERLASWIEKGMTAADARKEAFDSLRAAKVETVAAAPVATVGKDRAEDKPFDGLGDFFRSVVQAEQQPGRMDPRLRASGANTQVSTEGGFAVPAGQVNIFLDTMYSTGEVLSRVTRRPISVGNTYSERLLKESSRVSGSRFGGITTGWVGEGNDITASKPALREVNLTLRKVAAAAYLTEEQIADGPALESFIKQAAPEALRFAVEEAIYAGSGAGQPLGFLNAGGLVSQAIEGSQTIANTSEYIWKNASKMYGRMPASMRANAFWFINQELYANIITSTAGAAANGATTLFMAPGRLADAPNGAILGRPIVPVEYASAQGTVGDFVFANLSDYLVIDKGGVQQAQSLHVRFLQDEQVLKFTYRVDGSPRTNVAITPNKGTDTQSPYIALAARS